MLGVPHRARSPFHRVQHHRLNAYKYSVGGYRRAHRFKFWKLESELGEHYVNNVPGRHLGHLVMTPIWKRI
jgi:hypothetical protein